MLKNHPFGCYKGYHQHRFTQEDTPRWDYIHQSMHNSPERSEQHSHLAEKQSVSFSSHKAARATHTWSSRGSGPTGNSPPHALHSSLSFLRLDWFREGFWRARASAVLLRVNCQNAASQLVWKYSCVSGSSATTRVELKTVWQLSSTPTATAELSFVD